MLFSPLVVGDATQDVPTQRNQLDELDLIADSEKPRPGQSLLTFDLRLQIREREAPCRCEELALDRPAGLLAAASPCLVLIGLVNRPCPPEALSWSGGSGLGERDTGRRGRRERPAHRHRR